MKLKPYGDRAVLINFDQKIDPKINAEVIALTNSLEKENVQGLITCIPAYCSITIIYDPNLIIYDEICKEIERVFSHSRQLRLTKKRTLHIPVCYDPEYGLDLYEVGKQTGFQKENIIELHTNTTFQVYMLGFLPGFVYMGSLPKSLECTRRTVPRLKVPGRSVGLAGLQTGIYPSAAPGGWQIIGKTPLNIFDGNKENPFLFQAGDIVRFKKISKELFVGIEQEVTSESFNFEEIYE